MYNLFFMKKTFNIFLILALAITVSCKEEKPKTQPSKNKITATVKHYICMNKCENSGGPVAGICSTCNTPYTHNPAFHNDEFLKNGPLNVPKVNLGVNPKSNTPPPAQNALGVFHYTCPNGCNGGSGSASKCTSCGAGLVHNQTYHN